MKNERLASNLNVTKRNILFYLMLLAVVSLIVKSVSHISINLTTCMMEIYVLVLTLIIFVIQASKEIGVPVKDENIFKERYLIIKIGFYLVLWGGIGVHFISNLLNDQTLVIDTNSFTSLAILLGFIILILSSKKHGFYLNYKSIQKEIKPYYLAVLKGIGKLWLVAIGYATVIYSLSLSQSIAFEKVSGVWASILLSVILFSLQYFLFSVYEKIDYDEKNNLDEMKTKPFLSGKVILLGLPVIGYAIIFSLVMFFFWYSRSIGNQQNEMFYEALMKLLIIWRLDFSIIGLILAFVIYRSVKSMPFEKPTLFKYLPVLIWGNFAYIMINTMFAISFNILNLTISAERIISISQVSEYIGFGVMVITLVIHIYLYPFLRDRLFPATKLFLILPVLPILAYIFNNVFISDASGMENVMLKVSLVNLGSVVIYSLIRYFIYCRMTYTCLNIEDQKEKLKVKKVILQKKVIQ
ncbi:MAG: hypothetical protein ABII85_05295 [Bacillota bacterium]